MSPSVSDPRPEPAQKIDAEVVRKALIPPPSGLLFEQIAKAVNFTDCENQTLLASGETQDSLWSCLTDEETEDFTRIAKAAYAVIVRHGCAPIKTLQEPKP